MPATTTATPRLTIPSNPKENMDDETGSESMKVGELNSSQLRALKTKIDGRLSDLEARERQEKLARVVALIEELELPRLDVAEHLRGKKAGKRVAPKYRNPADAEQTWSGRGRKPRWFLDQIAAGKTPEDLAI